MTTVAHSTCNEGSAWLRPVPKLDGRTLMDHLWNRLDGVYPGKWRKDFPDVEAITSWQEAWAEAFDQDGITPQEVAAGIQACRRLYDWPPSLTEFMKACRPELIPENAFRLAVAGMTARSAGEVGTWPHPAIYWAAVRVGRHDLLNCGYSVMQKRWEAALAEELAMGTWNEVPAPAVALPAPGKGSCSPEVVQAQMNKIMASASAVLNDKGADPKRGARKILDEMAKKGGRRYSPAVVAMAQRALGQQAEVGQ